jgi:hypothetical protein
MFFFQHISHNLLDLASMQGYNWRINDNDLVYMSDKSNLWQNSCVQLIKKLI